MFQTQGYIHVKFIDTYINLFYMYVLHTEHSPFAGRKNSCCIELEKHAGIRYELSESPGEKIHRHLIWVLAISTAALIVNALVVVALVEGG